MAKTNPINQRHRLTYQIAKAIEDCFDLETSHLTWDRDEAAKVIAEVIQGVRRKYLQAHKAAFAAYSKAYYQAHKAAIAATAKAYYQAHKTKMAAYQKAYRLAHKRKKGGGA